MWVLKRNLFYGWGAHLRAIYILCGIVGVNGLLGLFSFYIWGNLLREPLNLPFETCNRCWQWQLGDGDIDAAVVR